MLVKTNVFQRLIFRLRIFICRIISNPVFIIKVEEGIVSKVSGTVSNRFMADCIDIFFMNNVQFGYVFTTKSDYGKPIICASREITKEALQQLRNSWSVN